MGNRAYLRHLEQLFLLEILVEKVELNEPCCVPMKVHVQFIDLLPFEIDQQEFRAELDAAAAAAEASAEAATEGMGCPETCVPPPEPPGKIATGKSCLFPMLPLELIKCLKRYPMILKLYQVMGECCTGELLDHLGSARVNMALPHFCNTIRRSTVCGERLPLVGCMASVYPLFKEDDEGRDMECGSIEIFARLSCFGHNILTHFQLLGSERAFVFKNSNKDEEKKCLICPKDYKPTCQQVIDTDVSPYKPCTAEDLWIEDNPSCIIGPRFADKSVEWGFQGVEFHPTDLPVCPTSIGCQPGECCPGIGQPCIPDCPPNTYNDQCCICLPCISENIAPMCPLPACEATPPEQCPGPSGSGACPSPDNCPPGSGHCPPESGHCPPGSGHCPPGSGHCPPGSDHCPPGSDHCPPGSGHCPPGSGHCPPGSGHCPPGSGHCPPGSGHCPPGSGHCPPGSGHCPPGSGHCPPGSGYCPPGSGHCPPGSGHCPPGSGHCPPGSGHCPGPENCSPELEHNSCCCNNCQSNVAPQTSYGLCPPEPRCPYANAPPPCNPPIPSVCTPNAYLQKMKPGPRNYYMNYTIIDDNPIEEKKEEKVKVEENKNVESKCPGVSFSTKCGPCSPKPPLGCILPAIDTCPGYGACPIGSCPSPPPTCPPPLKGSENWPPTPNVNIPCPLSCDVHKLLIPEELKCCPEECHEKDSKVPIRYDTTGKLSPAFMGDKLRLPIPRLHPPVRYDTTGALSPAFMGNIYDTSKHHPPVRYDTTGALSPAYKWSLKPPHSEGKRPCPGGCGGYEADSDDPDGRTCACKKLMGESSSSDENDNLCDCHDWGGMDVTYDFTPVKPLRPDGMGPIEPYESFDGGCVCGMKEEYTRKADTDPGHDHDNDDEETGDHGKHEETLHTKSEKDEDIKTNIGKKIKNKRRKQKHRPGVPRMKKARNIFRGRYVNKIGLRYPGIHIGHKHCMAKYPHVPSDMGWLWNLKETVFGMKFRPGWRPGSISKTVTLIMEGKEIAPVATRGGRQGWGMEPKSTGKPRGGKQGSSSKDEMNIRPTLHLHRRNGSYFISMHPVNINSETEAVPLQFKIPGNKDEGATEYGSDSSSELEIEFLAPGSFEPRKIEPIMKSLGMQVNDKDIIKATKFKKKEKAKGRSAKAGRGGVGGVGGIGGDEKNKGSMGVGASMIYQPKVVQQKDACSPCWDPCNTWIENCYAPCCTPCNPCCRY